MRAKRVRPVAGYVEFITSLSIDRNLKILLASFKKYKCIL